MQKKTKLKEGFVHDKYGDFVWCRVLGDEGSRSLEGREAEDEEQKEAWVKRRQLKNKTREGVRERQVWRFVVGADARATRKRGRRSKSKQGSI